MTVRPNRRSTTFAGRVRAHLALQRTPRGRLIRYGYSLITFGIALALILTRTWPVTLFASWEWFMRTFDGYVGVSLATMLAVHIALLPLRFWMKRTFLPPEHPEALKDSDLLDN